MNIKEVREMDAKTLAETKENLQEKLYQMKLNHTVTPLENPSQIKAVRRDIARLNTEIRQRELNK
ncbi:50S ribosomal protein L29 [uncultured Prevotella sp.]|uniref:50S ribosomal protein L29 n=1 Tax=uncultured Prevotella sp. TaxID=159272 RepID=UPI002623AC53|nr:50S ribosomal protein L29 [uncultured Prevotella sp.]